VAFLTIQPDGTRVECQIGESLYEIAWRLGRPLSSACGAKATCGLCRVKIVSGGELLTQLGDPDQKHLGNVFFITKTRLGCQARIAAEGEIVIERIAPPLPKKK
jgi:ferredoxin